MKKDLTELQERALRYYAGAGSVLGYRTISSRTKRSLKIRGLIGLPGEPFYARGYVISAKGQHYLNTHPIPRIK